ncbi:Hypothetical predicted protein [Lecanosticta acicola]|uniref:F-box domain-containing protein n=1 Tax=Lecanosticta acicola TaxID=111012 RepID=A0AAI8YU72_9PEZI|nr:Hypothetical predicted protein [Lecanosticta acicola]
MDWLADCRDQALQHLAIKQMRTGQIASLAERRRSSGRTPIQRPVMESPELLHPEKPSPILALPAELRDMIYCSLFNEENVQLIKPAYRFPGLLLANKQIHREATGLFYANSTFRCLDEDSAVRWLTNLPARWLELVPEVRYDTRWIIFITPVIPVPGAEFWLYRSLVRRLEERNFDLKVLQGPGAGAVAAREEEGWAGEVSEEMQKGTGRLKISYYQSGEGGCIRWTDKPGLIEVVSQ